MFFPGWSSEVLLKSKEGRNAARNTRSPRPTKEFDVVAVPVFDVAVILSSANKKIAGASLLKFET